MMLYKMKFKSILTLGCTLALLLFFSACSKDDDTPVGDDNDDVEEPVEPVNKTTGFIGVGSTGSGNQVVKYFEEIPTGTVDLSDGKDFSRFIPNSIQDGVIFTDRTDGSAGLAKMVVNSEGEIIEEAVISVVGGTRRIAVRDSEIGVFQDTATPNTIFVFNPTTFEVTGSIDMSAGFVPTDVTLHRYDRFIFRGDDVFSSVRNDVGGDFFTDYIVHQANLTTNTFTGDTQRDGNGSGGTIRNFLTLIGQDLVDTSGNLYMPDAGNYDATTGIAARLNKIPAGSNEIDPSYVFEPALTLNPANFLPTFNGFNILENGKAIARVNGDTPQEIIDIITAAGGVANLTTAEVTQISTILFTAASAVWCEIDLEAKTVTPITGIPNIGIFSDGDIFEDNGDVYIPALTSSENAYYKWNPTTGVASKAFTITGVDAPDFYNIEENK